MDNKTPVETVHQEDENKPVVRHLEDIKPDESFVAVIENVTPIPGIRPAGNLRTYHTALVGNHMVQIHMADAKIIEKLTPEGVIGSFQTKENGLRVTLDETIRQKFELQRVALVYEIKPEEKK